MLLRRSFAKPGIRPGLVDIAARADMQAGSLYYHFASREELVAENLEMHDLAVKRTKKVNFTMPTFDRGSGDGVIGADDPNFVGKEDVHRQILEKKAEMLKLMQLQKQDL